ncbi:unnamed protein product [Cunninghamella blakesleeana]
MANLFDQTPVFINPWGATQQSFSPLSNDNTMEEESKNNIPYRRPSLPQDLLNYSRQSSWSSVSSSYSSLSNSSISNSHHNNNSTSHHHSPELFGSIWQSSQQNNNNNNNSALPSPSFGFSSCSSPTSLTRSFPTATTTNTNQDQLSRPYRRFSLAPISYETNQDKINALTSVPEEPNQPYRRHSLAGPFLTNTPTSSSTLLKSTRSASLTIANSSLPMNSASLMPTCIEENNLFLPMDLLNSVDDHHQQQQNTSTFSSSTLSLDNSVSWCMIEFKAGRAEIYYSTIPLQLDDWVIVEADRGRDLGKVVAKDLPLDQVQLLLQATAASTTVASTNTYTTSNHLDSNYHQQHHLPSPSISSSSSSSSSSSTNNNNNSSNGSNSNSNTSLPVPKRICRLATSAEITLLVTKRHDEQKALLICQTKSKQKNLLMDIVDAEYQWDRRKLTFYFVADRRVDFRELVRDLFKIYKTRIWMCSVNSVGKRV